MSKWSEICSPFSIIDRPADNPCSGGFDSRTRLQSFRGRRHSIVRSFALASEPALGFFSDGGHSRKYPGNGSSIGSARQRAALAQEAIRTSLYKESSRGTRSRSARDCACVRAFDQPTVTPSLLPAMNIIVVPSARAWRARDACADSCGCPGAKRQAAPIQRPSTGARRCRSRCERPPSRTVVQRLSRNTRLSVTALMEPPMSGLMEPLTGADLGSRTG